MTETPTTTTPFLPPLTSEASPPPLPPANPPVTKTIIRLTRLSFYASLVSLIYILIAYVVTTLAPIYLPHYQYHLGPLTFWLAFTTLLSLLNLSTLGFGPPPHTTPLLLNLILDLVLAFGVLTPSLRLAIDLSSQVHYRTCRYEYPPNSDYLRSCWAWLGVTSGLVAICFIGGLFVGVSHLILFIIRGVNTWRSRFWSRRFPWVTPAGGHVALEFNVRVVRPDATAAEQVEGQQFGGMLEGGDDEEEAGGEERLVEV